MNNYVLSPYKLLLCLLINGTKTSSKLMDYLEKYVTHATLQNTKLEELSFKNFKMSLRKDIFDSASDHDSFSSHLSPTSIKNKFNMMFKGIRESSKGKSNAIIFRQTTRSDIRCHETYHQGRK